MTAPLGLAALTVLDIAPLQHVELAEQHGFDTIGLRLLPLRRAASRTRCTRTRLRSTP